MNFVLKYKVEIILGLIIIILYFTLRIPNLTLQPIFADEGIYIRWAQVMRAEPTLRFLPLSDGKTPLFMWSIIPLLKIFDDPLFAGRFLSVLAGFTTLSGVFLLSWRVFNLRVALWSALIYAIVPYTVFFDRMALVDSMLAAFTIWSLLFVIWILKSQRLDLAMILGYLLGGALLTKTPAMVNLLALPLTFLGFTFKKDKKYQLLKLLGSWVVAISIALLAYNLLRLGPEFHKLSARNADYVFSPADLARRPLDPFIPHLRDIADWFPKLLTWPILLIGGIGMIRVIWEKNKMGLVILIWTAVPLILQMAFLKTFTARYLLFSIPPLLVLAGYVFERAISSIKIITVIKIITAVFLISALPLYFDYFLLSDPQKAPLPKAERRGYFEDWTAGYNFKEIANFLVDKKKIGPVVVGTEGFFGTLPDGLQIYLDKSGIPVIGSTATISAKLRESAITNQTFFVSNNNNWDHMLEGSEIIKVYPKAKPLDSRAQGAIVIYKVLP